METGQYGLQECLTVLNALITEQEIQQNKSSRNELNKLEN